MTLASVYSQQEILKNLDSDPVNPINRGNAVSQTLNRIIGGGISNQKNAYDAYVKQINRHSAIALALVLLTGCSSGSVDATDEQVVAFSIQSKSNAPYLEKYSNNDDWKGLAEAVCNNIDSMTYGKVSDIVAAYIELPADSEEVDVVIESALENVCPSSKSE